MPDTSTKNRVENMDIQMAKEIRAFLLGRGLPPCSLTFRKISGEIIDNSPDYSSFFGHLATREKSLANETMKKRVENYIDFRKNILNL